MGEVRNEQDRRELAQQHAGDVIEGSGHAVAPRRLGQMVSLRLEPELAEALRKLAERQGISLSELLRHAAVQSLEAGQSNACDSSSDEMFDPPLDAGIARAVAILRAAEIETFESCEGGPGHSYPEPTVAFHGDPSEGFRAYAAAVGHGLRVFKLQRIWRVDYGELTGPWWQLVFAPAKEMAERGSWRDARGAVPLPEGAPLPEEVIRRIRGGGS